jgi:hypothetical protein
MISDKRDTAGENPVPLKSDHKRMKLIWDVDEYYGDYDEDRPDLLKGIHVVVFSAKYEVCDICEGKGRYVNPNIDRNGLNPDEYDYDFMEDYMNGVYDITCKRCGGNQVTLTICDGSIPDGRETDLYNLYISELGQSWESIREMEAETYAEQRAMGYEA